MTKLEIITEYTSIVEKIKLLKTQKFPTNEDFFNAHDELSSQLDTIRVHAIAEGHGDAVAAAIIGEFFPDQPQVVQIFLDRYHERPDILNLTEEELDSLTIEFIRPS